MSAVEYSDEEGKPMTAEHKPASETTVSRDRKAPPMSVRAVAGIVGGLAGGAVFGILMAMMGMLPMIASLVGSTSVGVGLAVHLVISVLIGLALTIPAAGLLSGSLLKSILVGALYGALWWVLGPLLIMPGMMGMPLFTLDGASVTSLMGHVIYGLILGLVAAMITRRRR
ncbi:F0F1-type ATP synthase assembly protein I [Arthrobacter sp. CAN_A6]